jgi:hypothetical protein
MAPAPQPVSQKLSGSLGTVLGHPGGSAALRGSLEAYPPKTARMSLRWQGSVCRGSGQELAQLGDRRAHMPLPITTGEAVQAVPLVSSIEEPQVAELLRRGQLAVEPGDGGSSSIDDGAVAGEHQIETLGGSENFALRLVNAARPQLPEIARTTSCAVHRSLAHQAAATGARRGAGRSAGGIGTASIASSFGDSARAEGNVPP